MSANIIIRRADGIVHVALNRPARKNAMLPEMWAELADIIASVENRPSDRVLVLTGEGGSFCAGADLAARFEPSADASRTMTAEELLAYIKQCVLALANMSKPSVAAVDGVAVGGGCNLALACDLVIASDRAQFSEIFVRRGLSVDTGGSWLLPRLVGNSRARRLVLLGEVIDADLAYEMGLVTHFVPAGEFQAEVVAVAAQLSEFPAATVAANKRLLAEARTLTLAEALDLETASQLDMLGQPYVEAARRAFFRQQRGETGVSISAAADSSRGRRQN